MRPGQMMWEMECEGRILNDMYFEQAMMIQLLVSIVCWQKGVNSSLRLLPCSMMIHLLQVSTQPIANDPLCLVQTFRARVGALLLPCDGSHHQRWVVEVLVAPRICILEPMSVGVPSVQICLCSFVPLSFKLL